MGERAMRPFWIHQLAELAIGIALISLGLQDPEPMVPTVIGTLIVANAASARGPLGAFKAIGRGLHRWLDLGVMVIVLASAVQPWVQVSAMGRTTTLVMLLPLGFLWFYTDWAERPARSQRRVAAAGSGGEDLGRAAGRIAGTGFRAARQAVRDRRG